MKRTVKKAYEFPLAPGDERKIKQMYKEGRTQKDLSLLFGVTVQTITKIIRTK